MIMFLKKLKDCFAWKYNDMKEVHWEMVHPHDSGSLASEKVLVPNEFRSCQDSVGGNTKATNKDRTKATK